MKIFNWVHRRFNNKAENVKKNGDIAAENEQISPGENKCDDVFERWRGGILAIGTFGYDPFMGENEQLSNGYFLEEDAHCDDDDDEDEDEDNPLVLATYNYNAEELSEPEMEENSKQLQFGFEYVMMKKEERTTLADLFNADSDEDRHAIAENRTFNKSDLLREKKSSRKHALSFGSKLTAKDARPIHKLNQLMRRMLRRKIHPDVGPTNSKVAAVNNNYNYNKCRTTDDYASLLPSQDANI